MNHQCDDKFYQLLRLSLRLTRELPVETDAETWQQLYHTAVRQSLVGVCYQGVCLMPEGNRPPVETALQWATQAETIRGMNGLLYQEAARLTQQFAEKGRRTAILKGQTNARLYPDPYSRQPGDIDIWVEGGKESVLALLPDHPTASYHHVHLPTDEKGVVVEIHFRPASGNHNPLTNRRLQRWLEQEILTAEMVEEGFCVPSVRFALVMQLAHIQRHFLSGGIGLRHICDYFLLLQQASPEDRQTIAPLLKPFGLAHTAGALMWVLAEVLQLEEEKMCCKKDSGRGEWLLREIMAGGNFGHYAQRQKHGVFRRVLEGRLRNLRLMRFDFQETLWVELNFWKAVIKTMPKRIRYRTLSLRNVPR